MAVDETVLEIAELLLVADLVTEAVTARRNAAADG